MCNQYEINFLSNMTWTVYIIIIFFIIQTHAININYHLKVNFIKNIQKDKIQSASHQSLNIYIERRTLVFPREGFWRSLGLLGGGCVKRLSAWLLELSHFQTYTLTCNSDHVHPSFSLDFSLTSCLLVDFYWFYPLTFFIFCILFLYLPFHSLFLYTDVLVLLMLLGLRYAFGNIHNITNETYYKEKWS